MITPQVGQVYDTTKLWNSDFKARRIVEVVGDVIRYQLIDADHDDVHFINVRGFNMAIKRGSWVLRYPDYMRLPRGA